MHTEKNVFSGADAIQDFMDPDKLPYVPLVEIPSTLNPLADKGVRVFAKMMNLLPLGNVKAVPAFNMIREQARRGDLEGVEALIENSSGNTVFSLAIAARQFGVEKTFSYVPAEISWNKLLMLLFFGVEPIVNQEPAKPADNDPASGVYKARRDGERPDMLNPGQYENPDNPGAHEKWTGPQIWDQTDGKLSIFAAALGTTGTLIGTSTYLKSHNPDLPVVGVMRAPEHYVPGARTEKLLNLVDFDWRAHVDHVECAESEVSYRLSMALSRRGLMAGPTSGMALAGLLQHLDKADAAGELDALRNADGEVLCVFPCPDGPLPYLDEYPRYVGAEEFPPIHNEELLLNKPRA
ncbi:MAG: pyridoxal-phosphate dependent enzyme [Gammaproteobacteria bacterium]|nr:pyridoxal-phosphate dependent enzyme [Gammaproteobacteria bacterium]